MKIGRLCSSKFTLSPLELHQTHYEIPKTSIISRYKYKSTSTNPGLERLIDECKEKRSIFVGALRKNITEDDLVQYFNGFGQVLRAVKCEDKETKEKKTYGFVDFAEFGVIQRIMNITQVGSE